jgi:hypothetical protein
MKPMRMLILLAVFWAAGSLLLAAETPPAPKPASTAQTDAKTGDAKAGAKEEGKQEESTDGSKPSISEQAEAALKVAAEADGSAAKEPPGGEGKDDTQAPPNGSAGKGSSPQRFVPSEQVRADFDVSFPIDI